MSEKIQLEFDMDTLQMLQRAQVFHNNFVGDKAAFVADFSSWYHNEVWLEGVV